MVKIAADLKNALAHRDATGCPGRAVSRLLAEGEGWSVSDVVCTSGPQDRPFEERHSRVTIAMVVAGTFQYRTNQGRHLMPPGSLLLGSPGEPFECGHQHGRGDRCISFSYNPKFFEGASLPGPRLPPLKQLSPLIAQASAALTAAPGFRWEDLTVQLASRTIHLAGSCPDVPNVAIARVTRVVRSIEQNLSSPLPLPALAHQAGLSPFHFIRIFEKVTGLTPHRYILRARLRDAATRLSTRHTKILDVALDCGFTDLSNFNRAFRTEFGTNPRTYAASVRQ